MYAVAAHAEMAGSPADVDSGGQRLVPDLLAGQLRPRDLLQRWRIVTP
jgi:hypothetical protein